MFVRNGCYHHRSKRVRTNRAKYDGQYKRLAREEPIDHWWRGIRMSGVIFLNNFEGN